VKSRKGAEEVVEEETCPPPLILQFQECPEEVVEEETC
jgi:hypothetical protein